MAEKTFTVPGYVVDGLLGYGATGEVWAAREVIAGEAVALKRLRAGPGMAGRERLLREATVLRAVQHPHLLRLRDVVVAGPDVVLVLDRAEGGSLARLLAGRAPLGAGQVVTLGVPLAGALAEVHRHGVTHGDVSPANILLTADGQPLLADLGVAHLVGLTPDEVAGTPRYVDPAVRAGALPSPASDVYALAAVCREALGGGPRRPGSAQLWQVLDAAQESDPAARPGAAEFARLLHEACPAVPLPAVAGPEPSPRLDSEELTRSLRAPAARAVASSREGRSGARHRSRDGAAPPWLRRTGTAAVLLVAVAAAAGLGLAWGRTSAGPPAAAVAEAPAADPVAADPVAAVDAEWSAILTTLDQRRSAAFGRADAQALSTVYAPSSPPLLRDQALLRQHAAVGVRARGLRHRLIGVREVTAPPGGGVTLVVRDRLAPYTLVDGRGRVVRQVAGRAAQAWTVTLVPRAGEWRIAAVSAV